MNIEIATKNSIFVELSAAECSVYRLMENDIPADDPSTGAALEQILSEIQTKTGRFLTQNSIEIDAVPGRNGGCLLLIFNHEETQENSRTLVCCRFASVDAFLDAATALKKRGHFLQNAELLQCNEEYFLLLPQMSDAQKFCLSEFSELTMLEAASAAVLREHSAHAINAVRLEIFCGA